MFESYVDKIPVINIMKSLTSKMYDHNDPEFNYEILEFFGDTILKLLTSA